MDSLSIPPLPGFRVPKRYDTHQPLDALGMMENVIFAFLELSENSWETTIEHGVLIERDPFGIELLADHKPIYLPSTMKTKHVALGLYNLGRDFTNRLFFCRVLADLVMDEQRIGGISIQRSFAGVSRNSSNDRQSDDYDRVNGNSTTLGDVDGILTDPNDINFKIYYTKHTTVPFVFIDDIFLTFIDALANAISHEALKDGAKVNSSITHRASAYLVIESASRGERLILRWGQCVQAVGLLWQYLRRQETPAAMTFEIEYAGEEIGFGTVSRDRPAGGDTMMSGTAGITSS